MRDLLKGWGVEGFLSRVSFGFTRSNDSISKARSQHLGVHAQKQSEHSYIGIALKLGWISIAQLQGLIQLAETYGAGEIRLSPWQSILLPNIPTAQTSTVLAAIKSLALSTDPIDSAIVACAGKPGCASSETHTQSHAIELMNALNRPINIHITGCSKGCAQPSPADITLLGTTIEGIEAYSMFAGEKLLTNHPIPATELSTIAHLINTLHD